MSKVKPTTKEQLVYYLIQNISLGTYDRRFLTNIQTIQLTRTSPITSNQADLLNKIVLRYAKQLRKKEIDADKMTKLPWGVEPLESSPEYTDAFCTIKDDRIEVRSPYNKDFIKAIKDTNIYLLWDKETKIWSGPFCEIVLRHFVECLDKYYQVIRYCDKTTEIITQFADYEDLCWNPTYKKINGKYYVVATNRHLDEAIKTIELNAKPDTLARLISYGIKIDDAVVEDAILELGDSLEAHEVIDFAVSDKPIFHIENLDKLVTFIKIIKCDYVIINEVFRNNFASAHHLELQNLLKENGIDFFNATKSNITLADASKYEFPIIINTALWGAGNATQKFRAAKTIHLGNNTPVKIR